MLEIVRVTNGENSVENLGHIRALFRAYVEWTGVDLSFQNFDEEFVNLPGGYAEPNGSLLIALMDGKPAGCVAVRKLAKLDAGICEMKRLYVKPEFNGQGLGKKLTQEIIAEGRRLGYAKMRLDTLAKMTAALNLYRSLGFREIEAYRFNPLPGTVYMELDLSTDEKV